MVTSEATIAAARLALGQAIMPVYERLAAQALRAGDTVDEAAIRPSTPRRYIRHVLSTRAIFEEDARIIGRFRREMGTILDIGAHWGYLAASFRHAGADGPILSFEPMTAHHGCLDEFRRIDGAYDFSPHGLSDREASVLLYGPLVNGQPIMGLNSIGGAIFNEHHKNHLVSLVGGEIPVAPRYEFKLMTTRFTTRRLDDVLAKRRFLVLKPFLVDVSRIAVIKLDVEGHEAPVLAGAQATIARHKPFVMIESGNRNAAVAALLRGHGYLYAEREGERLAPTDHHTTAANGFWYHPDRLDEYRALSLF
jgi:FkbM family methyltransferase